MRTINWWWCWNWNYDVAHEVKFLFYF